MNKFDRAFTILENAAAAGLRCPTYETDTDLHSFNVGTLARLGRIRVEVYGRNYRVVTILTGPHAGKGTKPAPAGRKPYRIIDGDGTRLNTMAMNRP